MRKDAEAFLKALLEAPSPSGFEQPAAKIFRERVADHVDDLVRDVHGNTMGVLNPKAPFKFMLAGHVDEIGLIITHIDDKGYLYTAQIGGMDPALLVGQRVKIMGNKGPVFGVIGRKAIHQMKPDERKKGVEMENIWVDIGADFICKHRPHEEVVVPLGVVDLYSLSGERDQVLDYRLVSLGGLSVSRPEVEEVADDDDRRRRGGDSSEKLYHRPVVFVCRVF